MTNQDNTTGNTGNTPNPTNSVHPTFNANLLSSIEKLKGSENYANWSFAIRNYIELCGLENCLAGTETNAQKNSLAKTSLVFSVDPVIYVHIREAVTAKSIWDKLKSVFEDNGLTRRIGLVRIFVATQLENCDSVEEYVNKIIGASHQLASIGLKMDDMWVGTFLLAGLPERYDPMIMGIESSGIKITGESIKLKLLQDICDYSKRGEATALFSGKKTYKGNNNNNRNSSSKGVRCFKCNKNGHKANECTSENKPDKSGSGSKKKSAAFSAVFLSGDFGKNDIYLDSGATYHMVAHESWLSNKTSSDVSEITVANQTFAKVKCKGSMTLRTVVNGIDIDITVKNVLCIPELSTNLLSLGTIQRNGCVAKFEGMGAFVFNNQNDLILKCKLLDNNIYLVAGKVNNAVCMLSTRNVDINIWHRRLGHMNGNDLIKMKNGVVSGICFDKNALNSCVPCHEGKHTRSSFKHSGTRASNVLELVHSDLCGPMEIKSLGGARYILVFVDDFSRKTFVYFLKTKCEVTKYFVTFKNMVETQTGLKLQKFRTDNGTEFTCNKMRAVFDSSGIIHQTSNYYTPEQNGVSERRIRMIVEKAKCMLFGAGLPTMFWAEAVNAAVHIINRSVTSTLNNMTPHEAFSGKKPDLSHLRVFGCDVMVHVAKEKRKKWSPKSIKMVFVGYCDGTKGYRVYNPNTKSVTKSCDVSFFEEEHTNFSIVTANSMTNQSYPQYDEDEIIIPISTDEMQQQQIVAVQADTVVEGRENENNDNASISTISIGDTEMSNDSNTSIDISQAVGESSTIDISDDDIDNSQFTSADESSEFDDTQNDPDYIPPVGNNSGTSFMVRAANIDSDPLTVREAMAHHSSAQWKRAMADEIKSLKENKTWLLVDLPVGKKPIQSKWVFKRKFDKEGNISKYKARLVVKGFTQKEGIDYTETFSPVARYGSIRFMLAMAVKYKLKIEQMDAVTAFLQGELSEEIYLSQPEEFNDGTNKVCRLKKAIYGLKQASREWNKKLDQKLREYGLKRSRIDPCIYHNIDGKSMLFVAVYVDDLLFFHNNNHQLNALKKYLMTNFHMKDLGPATSCVGMQIDQSANGERIEINQAKYIQDILVRFNMADCNPISTPVDPNQKLTSEMSPKSNVEKCEMANIPYQEAVGSILYLAQCTRPDIAFAVNNVSRFNNNPGSAHWVAVKRILRYLKGTINQKLVFTHSSDSGIQGFCDADFASDVDKRRSCTGYVFVLQGGAISWSSKRQQTVAISTTEAEYMALSNATQEAIYLKQFYEEFGMNRDQPIIIHCDNKSAINLASNDIYHPRTKHIDVKHHFVRQSVTNNMINVKYVSTNIMAADNLTKGVNSEKHLVCNKLFGLL